MDAVNQLILTVSSSPELLVASGGTFSAIVLYLMGEFFGGLHL